MKQNPYRPLLLLLIIYNLQLATFNPPPAAAATVIGNLKDISIQALDTKVMFAPTNEVLVTPGGLSAGPPKVIESGGGQFSIVLEAGDYTVSLPLVPWRHPFGISVMDTNGTVNITNLLSAPRAYTYTNNLNYTFKAIPTDTTPGVLDAKLSVAGSLTKSLVTNAGAVTIVLSNNTSGGGGGGGALHVNSAAVSCWSTNGEASLLDGTVRLAAGSLAVGTMITVEAFGSFGDPDGSIPNATFSLKLGSIIVATEGRNVSSANWHLRAALTVRATGVSGTAAGAIAVAHDNSGMPQFALDSQTATVDTTGALGLDFRALIDVGTGGESVTCDQLLIRIE